MICISHGFGTPTDMDELTKKLDETVARHEALVAEMSRPEVACDPNRYRKLAVEHAELGSLVARYSEYRNASKELQEAIEMADSEKDAEVVELAREEQTQLEEVVGKLTVKIREMLVPKDPNDQKDVIVEIRQAAGGDEAALFAADLFRMYSRYAERNALKIQELNSHPIGIGGFKEIVFSVEGDEAYGRLKFESGVHRVQRVPATESSGRIHTSTVTVAVLPEAEDVDISIDPSELRIDVFRSSGPGGQHVNKTESAVRVTHLPSGTVASCQDESSQHKNKAKAMKVLRARLLAFEQEKQQAKISQDRRSQVGTGARNEKIRTYNFPQDRVTDHRIGLTKHQLANVLDGDIEEFIEGLRSAERVRALEDSQ
jgi:peptide chain release factor 1